MLYWGVRMRFEGQEIVYIFETKLQAEYYLHLIPRLMVDGNKMVDGIKSARLVPII